MIHIPVSPDAKRVYYKLKNAGYPVFLVGGAVRDFFTGAETTDYDFTTQARPDQVQGLFRHTIPTGIKHGTITVVYGGKNFEITTFRKDGKYTDNRHPDSIKYTENLADDLSRRDFTINALAYDIQSEELTDLFGGIKDIEKKTIRAIGNAEQRFSEDYLRMLRAVRFASQLGFSLDPDVNNAILHQSENLSRISTERIREEFIKIIASPLPLEGIELCRTSGLLRIFMPELQQTIGVEQNQYHLYDVYTHSIKVLAAVKNTDYRIRLAALLHDIGKPVCKKNIDNKDEAVFYNHEIVGGGISRRILRRLKFSNEDVDLIVHLIKNHMFHYTQEWTKGAIRRFIRKAGETNLPVLFQLREADRIGNGKRSPDCTELREFRKKVDEIIKEESAFQLKDLAIDGNILMETFKLSPSRLIGNILKDILEKVLDNPELNTVDSLLRLSKEYLDHHSAPPSPENSSEKNKKYP